MEEGGKASSFHKNSTPSPLGGMGNSLEFAVVHSTSFKKRWATPKQGRRVLLLQPTTTALQATRGVERNKKARWGKASPATDQGSKKVGSGGCNSSTRQGSGQDGKKGGGFLLQPSPSPMAFIAMGDSRGALGPPQFSPQGGGRARSLPPAASCGLMGGGVN